MSEQEQLLRDVVTEQRKTNQLLAILIETLTDEEDDGEQEPQVYLDGTPTA